MPGRPRCLLPEKAGNARGSRLAGFAPDYNNLAAHRGFPATRNLAPLTQNQPEVRQITSLTGGKNFMGIQATESAFKAHAGDYRLLHLAMHALVNDSLPLYSSLVFYHEGPASQDGRLYAYEIYNLPLQAELLVLSACQTGYGKQRDGEGVMSLAHAFHYAGCPNIVTSLWQADDQSTARLMELFYLELKSGKPKDKALQQARLNYLAEGNQSHPFYWGAFVLVGDDAPVAMGTSPALAAWLICALIAVGFGWMLIRETGDN
ncbi:MAG: CHAT domain-containing protein [Bacteroidia bacterium]